MTDFAVRTLVTGLFAALIAVLVIREHFIALSLSSIKVIAWDTLLYKLRGVRAAEIKALARMPSHNNDSTSGHEWDQLVSKIGERDEVERLVSNANIFVELAYRTQDWKPGEGREIIDKIVKHHLHFRVHVRRFKMMSALAINIGKNSQLHQIASAYCAMVCNLLILYQATHAARVNQLAVACCWGYVAEQRFADSGLGVRP